MALANSTAPLTYPSTPIAVSLFYFKNTVSPAVAAR